MFQGVEVLVNIINQHAAGLCSRLAEAVTALGLSAPRVVRFQVGAKREVAPAVFAERIAPQRRGARQSHALDQDHAGSLRDGLHCAAHSLIKMSAQSARVPAAHDTRRRELRRATHARWLGDVARSTGDAHAHASSMRQSIGLGMNVGDLDDARISHAKWRARGMLAPCISSCPQSWAPASDGRPTRVACPPSSRCRRHSESASRSRALRVRRQASDERGGGRRRLKLRLLTT